MVFRLELKYSISISLSHVFVFEKDATPNPQITGPWVQMYQKKSQSCLMFSLVGVEREQIFIRNLLWVPTIVYLIEYQNYFPTGWEVVICQAKKWSKC